jgi:hypothetical protein
MNHTFSHTLLFRYRRTVRRGLHSATDTQLWYRSYVTSNTTVQYMERINDSTKADVSGCNNLFESRFKILLFIFRQGGVPLKLKSVSRIYTVYSATIMVCFYITAVCLFMDMFVHRRQLNYAMKKLRVFLAFAIAIWMHISFR